jgi:hypothetical protein
MSVIISGSQLRTILLGNRVTKATGTLAATTVPLFTIAGGQVLVTSMYGLITTSITVANSYKLQHNPTNGDTGDICAATDIGTNDSAAGGIIQFALATTTAPPKLITSSASGGGYATARLDVALTTGQIEHVSAGTDGAITWCLTWIPLTDGATLVAA